MPITRRCAKARLRGTIAATASRRGATPWHAQHRSGGKPVASCTCQWASSTALQDPQTQDRKKTDEHRQRGGTEEKARERPPSGGGRQRRRHRRPARARRRAAVHHRHRRLGRRPRGVENAAAGAAEEPGPQLRRRATSVAHLSQHDVAIARPRDDDAGPGHRGWHVAGAQHRLHHATEPQPDADRWPLPTRRTRPRVDAEALGEPLLRLSGGGDRRIDDRHHPLRHRFRRCRRHPCDQGRWRLHLLAGSRDSQVQWHATVSNRHRQRRLDPAAREHGFRDQPDRPQPRPDSGRDAGCDCPGNVEDAARQGAQSDQGGLLAVQGAHPVATYRAADGGEPRQYAARLPAGGRPNAGRTRQAVQGHPDLGHGLLPRHRRLCPRRQGGCRDPRRQAARRRRPRLGSRLRHR
ncbi:MAG: hypothetical protein FAZ92_01706 [Accumulibacter sp.]|nr:MAG: hypothetical protein FAZ92_01706 [Accumulibacter sp.]